MWFDERLVVTRSHAHLCVHLPCIIGVSSSTVQVSFHPLDSNVATPLSCMHQVFKYKFPCHVAMLHFVHALCALAMFLVYKFSFHPLTRTQMCFAVNLNFPQTKFPSIRYIIHYSEESKMKTSYIHVHTLLNYSAENVTFYVGRCFLAEKILV